MTFRSPPLLGVIAMMLATPTYARAPLGAEAATPGATGTATAPTSAWRTDRTDRGCTLSRDYGAGPEAMTLTFRVAWDGLLNTVQLSTVNQMGFQTHYGDAQLIVGAAQTQVTVPASSRADPDGLHRLTSIAVDETLPDPRGSATIGLRFDGGPMLALAMPGAKDAFAALDQCQDKLMDEWGIFPYERRHRSVIPKAGATPPPVLGPDGRPSPFQPNIVGNPGAWITNDDYPAEAMRAGQQGTVTILWTIGTDGRVSDCKVLASSGSPALDLASCAAITRRGRYSPALDSAGKPIPVHSARSVTWRLP